MRRNTFYLLIGVAGMLLAGVLWASIELAMPGRVQVSILVEVLVIWVAKRTVSETIEDDRTNLITQHAWSRRSRSSGSSSSW